MAEVSGKNRAIRLLVLGVLLRRLEHQVATTTNPTFPLQGFNYTSQTQTRKRGTHHH